MYANATRFGLGAPIGENYGDAVPPATAAEIAAMNTAIVGFGYTTADELARLEAPLGHDDLSMAYATGYRNDLSPDTPMDPANEAARAFAFIRSIHQLYAQQQDGTYTVPGSNFTVAKSDIIEGPTDLPDGTGYVIIRTDGFSNVPGFPNEQISWYRNSDYVADQSVNVSIRPGTCGAVRGKGAWYSVGAKGGQCPAPPVGWNRGFGLISPKALSTLQLPDTIFDGLSLAIDYTTGQPITVDTSAAPVVATAAPAPIAAPKLYQAPNAPSPSPGTAPAAPAAPAAPSTLYQPPASVPASSTPTPQPNVSIDLYQSPASSAPTPAPIAAPVDAPTSHGGLGLLLLIVGGGALLLSARKGGGTKTWQ